MRIECLETRIAPASLTFNDLDGDLVTITTSKGSPNDLAGAALFSPVQNGGQLLLRLDLTNAVFQGTNLNISARRDTVLGGDGFVSVGYVGATGRDLGTVLIDGDLGAIDAGDPSNPAAAIKSLSVQSMGRFGTAHGAPDLESNIDGGLGRLVVKGDLVEAFVNVVDSSSAAKGRIGSVTIGGSIFGGTAPGSGSLYGAHGLGPVKIGGDIVGGAGVTSGAVTADLGIAAVTVKGSLFGGTAPSSGVIFSSLGALGLVKIGGDVVGTDVVNTGRVFGKTQIGSIAVVGTIRGGGGEDSGKIHTDGTIGTVRIGGDVEGGDGFNSGTIFAPTSLGAVKIRGSIEGGSINQTGVVFSNGPIKSVTVAGSVIGGAGSGGGRIFTNGDLGPVKIGGDLVGLGPLSGSVYGGAIQSVSVGGSMVGGSGQDSGAITANPGGIGRVTIGLDVQGGAGAQSGRISSGAEIGSVVIGRTLAGGSSNFSGGIVASFGAIRSITIGGDLTGADHAGIDVLFGSGYIESQRIGSIFIGGSMRAGTDSGAGSLVQNASIVVQEAIGRIVIEGSVMGSLHADGNSADGNTTLAIIAVRGILPQAGDTRVPLAIGSVTIGGRVEHGAILAGYSGPFATPANGDAQIGRIRVGGDWIASRVAAGTNSGADFIAGTEDDTFLTGFPDMRSSIGSIIIKGQAIGTIGGSDSFRFMAERIGKVKIGSTVFPLTSSADNLLFSSTLDVRIFDNA